MAFNEVNLFAQEEGEDLKEVPVSKRTVSKMIRWKWSVPISLEIGRVLSFMTSNRPLEGEEEDLKEAQVSNRTVAKMICQKWSVLMRLEIDTAQAFMTLNRPRKEREKNRKRDMPAIELRLRLTGGKCFI